MTECVKKPFDLEKALAGAPFGNKRGEVPDEWHHFKSEDGLYSVYCVYNGEVKTFTKSGRYTYDVPHEEDLVMLPVKKTWWLASWKNQEDNGKRNTSIYAYDNKERLLACTDSRHNVHRAIHTFETEE